MSRGAPLLAQQSMDLDDVAESKVEIGASAWEGRLFRLLAAEAPVRFQPDLVAEQHSQI
jgi:hypothetical protein